MSVKQQSESLPQHSFNSHWVNESSTQRKHTIYAGRKTFKTAKLQTNNLNRSHITVTLLQVDKQVTSMIHLQKHIRVLFCTSCRQKLSSKSYFCSKLAWLLNADGDARDVRFLNAWSDSAVPHRNWSLWEIMTQLQEINNNIKYILQIFLKWSFNLLYRRLNQTIC